MTSQVVAPNNSRTFKCQSCGVDESGFLETNWRHGTKLGQFWDSDFLAISRAEMLQKLIDVVVLIDLYKIRSLVARK